MRKIINEYYQLYSNTQIEKSFSPHRIWYFLLGSATSILVVLVFFEFFARTHFLNNAIVSNQLTLFLSVLCGAIFEEIIFTYFLFRFLDRNFTRYLSLSTTCLIFATLHLGNSHSTYISFISHLIGSFLYIFAFIKTGNIFTSIGLHFGWNYTQIFYSQPMSGSFKEGFITISLPENQIIFGGNYGIEGGLCSIFLRAILVFIVLGYYKFIVRN